MICTQNNIITIFQLISDATFSYAYMHGQTPYDVWHNIAHGTREVTQVLTYLCHSLFTYIEIICS